jgi:hypothetical protein
MKLAMVGVGARAVKNCMVLNNCLIAQVVNLSAQATSWIKKAVYDAYRHSSSKNGFGTNELRHFD